MKGRKTGFCISTTWRYYNNEYVPFNTPYEFCDYQGIAPGWGDLFYFINFIYFFTNPLMKFNYFL